MTVPGSQAFQPVASGLRPLDELIDYFRLGDNVVWQVESMVDYDWFARAFADQAAIDHRTLIYVRFGSHAPVLPLDGVEAADGSGRRVVEKVDPRAGFDVFSAQVNRIITHWGRAVYYVFDNLSSLVDLWATDELLANFFQATCPYLFELDTVAYFALTRGRHADDAVARIRDTTQVLLDTFHYQTALHVRPLKVWRRHSTRMFWPHRVEPDAWIPVPQSKVPATTLAHETRAPWDIVYAELKILHALDAGDTDQARIQRLQQELTRMLLGTDATILRLAEKYLSLAALMHIRRRVVGSGRIGGKAAGMLLARAIARLECEADAFPSGDTDSFHIGSDVFYTFLIHNNLFRERLAITRAGRLSHEAFAALEQRFLDGVFDEARKKQFAALLEEIGEAPIIVRSSSLLEDGFGNAFAGKYRSEFCVNCGPLEQRLEAFMRAVKRVYASTLNPDALSYRRNRNMLASDEQMAILVQRVAGQPHGRFFFPTLAGVAFSHNLYAWTDRIDPEAGMIRLVFGLGTRAVNRVSRDYPRMIAVSHPQLRPEIGEEISVYSQRDVDLLDLDQVAFRTVRLDEVLREKRHPLLHWLVSTRRDGYLADPVGVRVNPIDAVVLTYNRLLQHTPFVSLIGRMLKALERAYGQAVDTEFAAECSPQGAVSINILQCRPMWLPGATDHVDVPDDIPAERVLFRSRRFLNGGVIAPVRYILFVDPRHYAALQSDEVRKALPQVVGRINRDRRIGKGRIMMIGPGRWGSSNPDLGIRVGYADIDQVSVLVEVADEADGHVPEVSYGTHFFQDLVEAEIIYMPVYPADPAVEFNRDFFEQAPNVLADLFPGLAGYQEIVRLIDMAKTGNGDERVQLVADPASRQALCYLGG